MKIEHIGIAVNNAEIWKQKYLDIFPDVKFKEEIIASQKTKVTFVMADNLKLELLEPTDESSTVYKFLAKKGEGLHHIAYMVDDLAATMKEKKELGYEFLYEVPNIGAEGLYVNFMHPKNTQKMLTEFCQIPK